MAMQNVCCDVWPEFAKGIGRGVTQQGISILRADRSERPRFARVVCQRDAQRHPPTQQLGRVDGIVPVVIRRDDDASGRVNKALHKATLAFGIVTFVLMKYRRQSENHKIVSVRLPAPVISSKPGHTFPQLWMGVGFLRDHGGESNENKRGVIERVFRGDHKGFFWSRWRRNGPGADCPEIRHDAENSFGLLLRGVNGVLPRLSVRLALVPSACWRWLRILLALFLKTHELTGLQTDRRRRRTVLLGMGANRRQRKCQTERTKQLTFTSHGNLASKKHFFHPREHWLANYLNSNSVLQGAARPFPFSKVFSRLRNSDEPSAISVARNTSVASFCYRACDFYWRRFAYRRSFSGRPAHNPAPQPTFQHCEAL